MIGGDPVYDGSSGGMGGLEQGTAGNVHAESATGEPQYSVGEQLVRRAVAIHWLAELETADAERVRRRWAVLVVGGAPFILELDSSGPTTSGLLRPLSPCCRARVSSGGEGTTACNECGFQYHTPLGAVAPQLPRSKRVQERLNRFFEDWLLAHGVDPLLGALLAEPAVERINQVLEDPLPPLQRVDTVGAAHLLSELLATLPH